jgi:hypothetical protein
MLMCANGNTDGQKGHDENQKFRHPFSAEMTTCTRRGSRGNWTQVRARFVVTKERRNKRKMQSKIPFKSAKQQLLCMTVAEVALTLVQNAGASHPGFAVPGQLRKINSDKWAQRPGSFVCQCVLFTVTNKTRHSSVKLPTLRTSPAAPVKTGSNAMVIRVLQLLTAISRANGVRPQW